MVSIFPNEVVCLRLISAVLMEIHEECQTDRGRIFEMLADLMDEDGASAELEDLDMLGIWLIADVWVEFRLKTDLLDDEIKEKLPPIFSGRESTSRAASRPGPHSPANMQTIASNAFF